AISTFRVAADLCEEYGAFIFNHNEAVLYRWVEEYEPALFARIQRLVRAGRWSIMGGWWLQPDCNMPSGESFVRQILLGKAYFREKFGVEPTTAINFDSFGHTRGLVQILAKSGYDSYLHCRPDNHDCPLPDNDYLWVGFDGSTVRGHRALDFYCSSLGHAVDKVDGWLQWNPERSIGLLLWGVGDHGGGPSHLDVKQLTAYLAEHRDVDIRHSTPEAYFADMHATASDLPRVESDLNSFAVGCYTSQVRLKQQHRLLENELYLTEKMLSHAALNGLLAYPHVDLSEAMRDLCFAEFHDILPGSSVQPVEETSLRLLAHGQELISRQRARAFFALAGGQPVAAEGEIPILIYNPHPFPVRGVFECEFMLADQNWTPTFTQVQVFQGDTALPSQVEKELSNLALDWRKRVAFSAVLQPGQMNRFDCKLERIDARPAPTLIAADGRFTFRTAELEVVINTQTGLLDRYRVDGVDYLQPEAFLPLVIADSADPWGMTVQRFNTVKDRFTLLSAEEGTAFSGLHGAAISSVRVIEDGAARTVVEAVLGYQSSRIVLQYKLPKQGTEVEVHVRVHWNEKDTMLKLALPSALPEPQYRGQVAYGVDTLRMDGREVVAQKWVAAVAAAHSFTCINDGSYGSDWEDGIMRLSLLRSPAYTGHPIGDQPIVRDDRYTPRIDQGERLFRFWIKGSATTERLAAIDREALAHNEKPVALSFFPHGGGTIPAPFAILSDDVVQLSTFKQAEDGHGYIFRLFEPTGSARDTVLEIPALGLNFPVKLGAFEIKSLRLDGETGAISEVDLLERALEDTNETSQTD
ncbi:MAG: glycoside hydrolase family 38 C-terminal domain-containing protein, partial [bacterium]